jgi:hypothetical protein
MKDIFEEEQPKGRPLRIDCLGSKSPHKPHGKKRCICGTHSYRLLEKKNKLRRIQYQNGDLFLWMNSNMIFGHNPRWLLLIARMKGGYKRNLTRSD